jgi:hypothetical protein
VAQLAACLHGSSCVVNVAHGLAGPASRCGPRARGRRWKAAHATTSARAHACAALTLTRCPRHGGGSGPGSTAPFGTSVSLRHTDGEAVMQHKGKGPHRQCLDGGGVGEVDCRCRRCSGTRDLAATYAGRRRRGGAASNRSTRRRKRGERSDQFSRWTTTRRTYPRRRRGRWWRGALGHTLSEAEQRRLRTRAVGRRTRRGERSGCRGGTLRTRRRRFGQRRCRPVP